MMRTPAACLAIVLALVSCGGSEPYPEPPDAGILEAGPVPLDPFCGDGICDAYLGEDEWWCVDCGYSELLGGPADGGYCGDGVCFGTETVSSCFEDCRPKPMPQEQPVWDPGYIDPRPVRLGRPQFARVRTQLDPELSP